MKKQSREMGKGGSTCRRESGGTNYERESREMESGGINRERESGGIERKSNNGSWRRATRRIRYRKLAFNIHSTGRSKSPAEAKHFVSNAHKRSRHAAHLCDIVDFPPITKRAKDAAGELHDLVYKKIALG